MMLDRLRVSGRRETHMPAEGSAWGTMLFFPGVFLWLELVLRLAAGHSLRYLPISAAFALAAGVCGGLFSIGGPLLSIYFLAMFPSKRSYLANLQTLFVFTNLINTATRIYCGIYTWALVPLTLVGIVGVNVGKGIGLRILDRIDIRWMKRMVYIFIGISGVLTLIDHT